MRKWQKEQISPAREKAGSIGSNSISSFSMVSLPSAVNNALFRSGEILEE